MKGKLNKQGDRWVLYNEDGSKIALSTESPFKKLSIKNCESIENGYDLDELAKVFYEQHKFASSHIADITSFKLGFEKSIELNKNKLFTLEDMMNCWNKALTFQDHKELFGHHIQSLKQSEWDVEIDVLMTEREGGVVIETPKLDADGCLILKRI